MISQSVFEILFSMQRILVKTDYIRYNLDIQESLLSIALCIHTQSVKWDNPKASQPERKQK